MSTPEVGAFLRVLTVDGTILAQPDQVEAIDAAVSHYHETNRNGLLYIQTIAGDVRRVLVSRIVQLAPSTPETRMQYALIDRALTAETAPTTY